MQWNALNRNSHAFFQQNFVSRDFSMESGVYY